MDCKKNQRHPRSGHTLESLLHTAWLQYRLPAKRCRMIQVDINTDLIGLTNKVDVVIQDIVKRVITKNTAQACSSY